MLFYDVTSSDARLCLCPAEVHPLLGVKGDSKSKKKAAGRPKGSKGKDKDSPFRPKVCRDRAEGLGTPGKMTFDPPPCPAWGRCGLSSAVIGCLPSCPSCSDHPPPNHSHDALQQNSRTKTGLIIKILNRNKDCWFLF